MTAHASVASVVEALRTGFVDYLIKPFPSLEFVQASPTRIIETQALRRHNTDLIEDLKRQKAHLEAQAVRDPLTGLINRGFLQEALEREVSRASRYQLQVTLIAINIDRLAGLLALSQLTPGFVKLDRELVRRVLEDLRTERLVRHLVDFANDEGIIVIAEGIETDREREKLEELGCGLLQGFLLGCPARRSAADAAPECESKSTVSVGEAIVARGSKRGRAWHGP